MSGIPRPRHAIGGATLRLVAWIAALAIVMLPLIAVVNGWIAVGHWPFRQLKLDAPYARVSAEQVRAAVLPQLEPGFFAVDLAAVRAAVEQLPWVATAEVRKRWPDLLEIRLTERVAVAVWGDRRLVDAHGELFAVPGEAAPAGLPRLSGTDARAAEVLAFYDVVRRRFAGSGLALAGVALSERGSWTLELVTGARVVVGREAPHERIARFVEALPRIAEDPAALLVSADLRYANGFAAAWRAPEPAPEAPAAPADAPPAALDDDVPGNPA